MELIEITRRDGLPSSPAVLLAAGWQRKCTNSRRLAGGHALALHRAAKHFGRQRPAGRAALTQSLLVERNDRDPGRGERTLDMRRDVNNDALVELQLTVGGKLEDNAAQHGIIRLLEHNDRQCAQPRYGVRQ